MPIYRNSAPKWETFFILFIMFSTIEMFVFWGIKPVFRSFILPSFFPIIFFVFSIKCKFLYIVIYSFPPLLKKKEYIYIIYILKNKIKINYNIYNKMINKKSDISPQLLTHEKARPPLMTFQHF